METIINYCLDNPFLIESVLADVDYPTLCDRVYDLTEGRGLNEWAEEVCTPSNWLEVQKLIKSIDCVMAQKARSQVTYLDDYRLMVA